MSANTKNAAYTDENGTCHLEAWAHDTGSVEVTVSAEGYTSYKGSILVLQTENTTEIGLQLSGPTPIPSETPPAIPTPTTTPADVPLGDVNMDGSIDIIDALLTAQYYVGLLTGFC